MKKQVPEQSPRAAATPKAVRTPAGLDPAEDCRHTFAALRELLARHASTLRVTKDGAEHYELYSTRDLNGTPLYFAGVSRRRSHVSFYLFPVCSHPDLLAGISEALKGRLQGRSCFNFEAPDAELFQELAVLTKRGLDRYRAEGWV